jgi:hypothetical protein
MKVTKAFLTKSFKKLNVEYFNGELVEPLFKVTHKRRCLGRCEKTKGVYIISISTYYDRAEREVNETLLHEMIHLYIYQKGIKDTKPHHGKVFYSIADRINKQGEWDIKSTTPLKEWGVCDASVRNHTYNVFGLQTYSNHYFLMVAHPKYVDDYIEAFQDKSFYTDFFKFVSEDDKKYSTYCVCRTAMRGREISREEYLRLKEIALSKQELKQVV